MRYTDGMLRHLCILSFALSACATNDKPNKNVASPEAAPTTTRPASAKPKQAPTVTAAIGQPAPDFSLPSIDGKTIRLRDYRGKTVVLEWFNPDCPFVRTAHLEGNLKGLGKRYSEKGVVWLAINSNAPGRQGSSKDANVRGTKKFNISYPVLLDAKGTVGKLYGATRTPHMYVINPAGKLVYAGALDNSRGGDIEDQKNPILYVAKAIDSIESKTPLATPQTKPWGCSVKYAP